MIDIKELTKRLTLFYCDDIISKLEVMKWSRDL